MSKFSPPPTARIRYKEHTETEPPRIWVNGTELKHNASNHLVRTNSQPRFAWGEESLQSAQSALEICMFLYPIGLAHKVYTTFQKWFVCEAQEGTYIYDLTEFNTQVIAPCIDERSDYREWGVRENNGKELKPKELTEQQRELLKRGMQYIFPDPDSE